MPITYSETRELATDAVVALSRANAWSAAEKPELLLAALRGSHGLVTAWDGDVLLGLGNALSDGHLVVYYPHLLVHPEYQGRGIGREIMLRLKEKYCGFHMHMLVSDRTTTEFYEKCGFERAGETVPMWIYAGEEH